MRTMTNKGDGMRTVRWKLERGPYIPSSDDDEAPAGAKKEKERDDDTPMRRCADCAAAGQRSSARGALGVVVLHGEALELVGVASHESFACPKGHIAHPRRRTSLRTPTDGLASCVGFDTSTDQKYPNRPTD